MTMPIEQQKTSFSSEEITTLQKVLIDGNTTGFSFNQILQNSRLEITVVSSLLNRLLERGWLYANNTRYRLNDNGNRSVRELLDTKEEIINLQVVND